MTAINLFSKELIPRPAIPGQYEGVADTVEAGETKGLLKLTVKEKLLVELGEHRQERDQAEYPLELTQKGLSDTLGVRRSHVAISLQGLVEEKLVEPLKARVESEKRRQNIYLLTPAGLRKAREIKDSVLTIQAEFEMPEGVKHTEASQFLKQAKAPLISVINQLERGNLVRDEITIVTRRERKLISVFCPTCKRNIEVENVFLEEEVGFDCPGCGRPYRIAPAERVIARTEPSGVKELWFAFLTLILAVGGYAVYKEAFNASIEGGIITAGVIVLLLVAMYLAFTLDWKAVPRTSIISAKVIVSSIIFGVPFVLLWNFTITGIDFQQEMIWFGSVMLGIAFGYVGTSMTVPDLKGEFLLTTGTLLLLVCAATLFIEPLEGLSLDSTPFLGIPGVTLLLLASLTQTERNTEALAMILAAGVFVGALTVIVLLPSVDDVLGAVVVAAALVLSALMISLRPAQLTTALPLGETFASTLPFAAGALFASVGLFIIWGQSVLMGLIEVGLMAPFLYFGLKKILDGDWMYKLPIAAYLVFFEVLALAYALLT